MIMPMASYLNSFLWKYIKNTRTYTHRLHKYTQLHIDIVTGYIIISKIHVHILIGYIITSKIHVHTLTGYISTSKIN